MGLLGQSLAGQPFRVGRVPLPPVVARPRTRSLLGPPVLAPNIQFVQVLYESGLIDTGSVSADTITLPASATAGNRVFLWIAVSPTVAANPTVTDSQGNTWHVANRRSGTGVTVMLASTPQDVAPLQLGDTITITYATALSAPTRAFLTAEFSGISSSSATSYTDPGWDPQESTFATGTGTAWSTADSSPTPYTNGVTLIAVGVAATQGTVTPGPAAIAVGTVNAGSALCLFVEYQLYCSRSASVPARSATGDTSGAWVCMGAGYYEAPWVSGLNAPGETLVASGGIWFTPNSHTYQWQSSLDAITWADIGGATGSSYVVQAADLGYTIRVVNKNTV